MPLTPRQRALAAIHHEEPDRVPILSSPCTVGVSEPESGARLS